MSGSAEKLLEDARLEVASLEARLARAREVVAWIEEKLNLTANATPATAKHSHPSPPPVRNGVATPYSGMTISVAAMAVLEKGGGPMKTGEIADALLAGGYRTRKPEGLRNAIFSTLRREPETFKKVSSGLWDLLIRDGESHP